MKRRDFITKSIGLIAIGSTTGLVGIMKPNFTENPSDDLSYFSNQVFEVVNLPVNPALYEDIINLSYTKGSIPILLKTDDLINGVYKEIYINEPGEYQLQFTGGHYGWSLS